MKQNQRLIGSGTHASAHGIAHRAPVGHRRNTCRCGLAYLTEGHIQPYVSRGRLGRMLSVTANRLDSPWAIAEPSRGYLPSTEAFCAVATGIELR